jgi:hypothetical protein
VQAHCAEFTGRPDAIVSSAPNNLAMASPFSFSAAKPNAVPKKERLEPEGLDYFEVSSSTPRKVVKSSNTAPRINPMFLRKAPPYDQDEEPSEEPHEGGLDAPSLGIFGKKAPSYRRRRVQPLRDLPTEEPSETKSFSLRTKMQSPDDVLRNEIAAAAVERIHARQAAHLKSRAKMKADHVLAPDSNFIKLWDVAQVAFIFYVATAIPYRIGFDEGAVPWQFAFIFEVLVDRYMTQITDCGYV